MNIFIAGGGRVGYHLARLLSSEHQNVTIIEADRDQGEQLDYALDIGVMIGDGSSVMLQQQLGVGTADIFFASMGNDEANLIAAATAKGLGAKQTVARVANPMYVESNILYETILGIDYILSPDALAALEIASYIEHPGVLATEDFGRGLVQMRQVRVDYSPTIGGKTLKDVLSPGGRVLVGVVDRAGKSFIPHGDTVIEVGDHITLIGHKDKLAQVEKLFHEGGALPRRVAIMGGGNLGMRVAKALDGKIKSVKVFERREEKCGRLAEQLNKAKIVCRDATSRVALEQEHVDKVDIFVAATNDDERNIMASVLAKEVGAKHVIAIINQPDFAPLVKRLGIDLAVTPRASVANRILRLAHQGSVTALAVLAEGQVEVLEFTVGDGSTVLNQPLKTVRSKFPRGALIATIVRGEKVFVPGGDDDIRAGDAVILIASADALEAASKLLQRK